MATVRVEKTSDYTVLSNHALDNEALSLKAVGLLVYMLRMPDGWNFTLEWLARKHKDGLASIRSAMKELEAAGYVTSNGQARTDKGTYQGADYIVREVPDGTACENRTRTACENPISENRMRSNTKRVNNNPPAAPQGAASVPKWKPDRFAGLWDYYPRHTSKQAAAKAWDKLKPSDELIADIGRALRRQKAWDEWQRGVGIPHLSTYLNQRRWEDELEEARSVPDAPKQEEGPEWI